MKIMTKLFLSLLALSLFGCATDRNVKIVHLDGRLDVKKTFSLLEQYFGQQFSGDSISQKEKKLESFFVGWSRERISAFFEEREKEAELPHRLEIRDETVMLLFEFIGTRNSRHDMQVISITFKLANSRVIAVVVHNSFSYDLPNETEKRGRAADVDVPPSKPTR